MPISREYKAAFVHVPRTGGSSIEKALGIMGVNNEGSQRPSAEILYGIHQGVALQHLPAREIKKFVPDYFTFSFVRNPFDRVVSEYFYRQDQQPEMDFKSFLFSVVLPERQGYFERHIFSDHYFDQIQFLTDERGHTLVDFVGRFENLEKDFNKICRMIGQDLKLPHMGKTIRRSYRDYYDHESIDLVSQVYQRDLRAFHYQF
jgi:hypothetical protein